MTESVIEQASPPSGVGAAWRRWRDQLAELRGMPAVTIGLMRGAAEGNDPFYAGLVDRFYAETRARHRRFPLIRRWQWGVAACALPRTPDGYLAAIEAAGRRNVKKAQRLGYRFERIRHNDHLAGMTAIHRSTEMRQGRMPEEVLQRDVPPCNDPPSRTNVHDYPYFGVLQGDTLVAYAGCLVAGEALMIEQLYGHAAHHADGVVPLLLVGMAGYALEHYPHVRYYVNEMYFGAGPTLRRFKKKFGFVPHRVTWDYGLRSP
jgi:hypothetical protein